MIEPRRNHSATKKVRASQEQRILDLLRSAHGAEVSAIEVQRVSGLQYSRAVHALRSKGYDIANRVETKDGVRFGWFRLIVPRPLRTPEKTAETADLFPSGSAPVRHRDDG